MTEDLAHQIATAARALEDEVGSQETMEKVVELAKKMMASCERAGITLIRQGQIYSPAESDDLVKRVDELQVEYQQGPCVDAILEHEIVYSANLADDKRWPHWGPRTVEETGIRSMMCFRLFTRGDLVGALNLYASLKGAFDAGDRDVGVALAAHAAIAVAAAHEIENLHAAVDGRTVIGQATGILMERFNIDADQAFAVLKRISQDANRKVRDIAHELVTTRSVPDA